MKDPIIIFQQTGNLEGGVTHESPLLIYTGDSG